MATLRDDLNAFISADLSALPPGIEAAIADLAGLEIGNDSFISAPIDIGQFVRNIEEFTHLLQTFQQSDPNRTALEQYIQANDPVYYATFLAQSDALQDDINVVMADADPSFLDILSANGTVTWAAVTGVASALYEALLTQADSLDNAMTAARGLIVEPSFQLGLTAGLAARIEDDAAAIETLSSYYHRLSSACSTGIAGLAVLYQNTTPEARLNAIAEFMGALGPLLQEYNTYSELISEHAALPVVQSMVDFVGAAQAFYDGMVSRDAIYEARAADGLTGLSQNFLEDASAIEAVDMATALLDLVNAFRSFFDKAMGPQAAAVWGYAFDAAAAVSNVISQSGVASWLLEVNQFQTYQALFPIVQQYQALVSDALQHADAATGGVWGANLSSIEPDYGPGDTFVSDEDHHYYYGGAENDGASGDGEADRFYGNGGHDYLYGAGGDDRLFGGTGNDNVHGGEGADHIDGGAGDDILSVGGGGADTIIGGDGFDRLGLYRWDMTTNETITVVNGGFTLSDGTTVSGIEYLDLQTGSGNDTLTFTPLLAELHSWHGGGGSDRAVLNFASATSGVVATLLYYDFHNNVSYSGSVRAGDGNGNGIYLAEVESIDLTSGSGNDSLQGAFGNDRLIGGAGEDYLYGNSGNDWLEGGTENDNVHGGEGADHIDGGAGNDILSVGGGGADTIIGGDGLDRLGLYRWDMMTNETITVVNGGFTLSDGTTVSGIEYLDLQTGSGNDTLTFTPLLAELHSWHGGGGSDRAVLNFASATSGVVATLLYYDFHNNVSYSGSVRAGDGNGNGISLASVESIDLTSGSGNDSLQGAFGNDRLIGGAGEDYLYGNSGDDWLEGGTETDTLVGGDGIDTLDGGSGADEMLGGDGNDLYYVENAGDVVTESTASVAIGGTDRVIASITYTLPVNVENLTMVGTGSTIGNGNGSNNFMSGNAQNNTLRGWGGNDVFYGNLGNDWMSGGLGQDYFVFNTALGPNNRDGITDFVHADDTIRLENAIFTGLGLATGTLTAAAFHAGTAAHDADDRIIYNAANGQILYDADGLGGTAAVLFATLTNKPTNIDHTDFVII